MIFGSLFTGIGGFDRGLIDAGHEIAWTVELADFPHEVLAARFPDVDHRRDIRDLTDPPAVDGLAGGFPCQDLAAPGKGTGITGDRSGLWSEYARIIAEADPEIVLIENVPLLLRRGMEVVIHDLQERGYTAEWDCLPAAAFGAPHLRDRVWIVAKRGTERPDVFGQPAGLFPHDWHELPQTDQGWLRWPRAGLVSPDGLLELDPIAPLARYRNNGHAIPTPNASDGLGGRNEISAYRRAAEEAIANGRPAPRTLTRPSGAKAALTLRTWAATSDLWPTPKASPSGPDYARAGRERSGGDDLATAVARKNPGPLNPRWVEWLMGFPLGWTDPRIPNADLVDAPWPHEPDDVPRTTDINERRGERLTALGNALVPAIAAELAA